MEIKIYEHKDDSIPRIRATVPNERWKRYKGNDDYWQRENVLDGEIDCIYPATKHCNGKKLCIEFRKSEKMLATYLPEGTVITEYIPF